MTTSMTTSMTTMYKNISDGDFIDDEKNFDENVEDYYTFTNVSRSVEDAMQDSFIDFDYSQEANNYCPNDYNPSEKIIVEFKDSAKKVEDFNGTRLIPQGFEFIDSFYYVIPYTIQYQLKNKKTGCQNDNESQKYVDNDNLYDALSPAKEKLQINLDIQNFENQCFSVNNLLNKYGLFLRVYELKDKFCYLIKQDFEERTVLRELSSCIVENFNGINIVRVDFSKKLRQPFRPINIIYKPVKKM